MLLVMVGQLFCAKSGFCDHVAKSSRHQKMTIEQQADEMKRIQTHAYKLLESQLPKDTEEKAISAVLDYLRQEPFVKKAGVSKGTTGQGMPTIWIRYQNKMEGGVTYREPGYR